MSFTIDNRPVLGLIVIMDIRKNRDLKYFRCCFCSLLNLRSAQRSDDFL